MKKGYFIEIVPEEYYAILYSEEITFISQYSSCNAYYEAIAKEKIFEYNLTKSDYGHRNEYEDIHEDLIFSSKEEAIRTFIRLIFGEN